MKNKEQQIKDYLIGIANTDRYGTAFPVYYVIKDKTTEFVKDEYGEPHVYEDGCFHSYEYFQDDMTKEEFESMDEIVNGYMEDVWSTQNNTMFLTEDEAKQHLKENSHHYSEDAYVYCCHIWRNEPLKQFIMNLFDYFGVENKT